MAVDKILIDGYNLLKSGGISFPNLPGDEAKKVAMIKILNSSASLQNKQVIVIFDGVKPPLSSGGFKKIKIIYSGAKKEADDVIKEMIRSAPDPRQITVVSSDRAIRNTAKDHGATPVYSTTFWKQIQARSSKKEKKKTEANPDRELSDKEVREWLDIFHGEKKE